MSSSNNHRSTLHRYKGSEYHWDDGNHKLLFNGDVYQLKYRFEKGYIPTYKEVMDVVDDWTNWSSTISKRNS